MARGKKDQKVETLRHRSGLSVDIFFNPNPDGEYGLTFNAKVGDMRFHNANAGQLRQEVYKYLNDNLGLTWHPVIIVSEVAPFSPGRASFVGIEVHRVYLANGADGRIRQLDWDDYEVEEGAFGRTQDESIDSYRLSRSQQHWMGMGKVPDSLPYKTKSSDKESSVLPYSEELYAGLVEIDSGIDRLKVKLRELLTDSQGWKRIAEVGAQITKLLPAPEVAPAEIKTPKKVLAKAIELEKREHGTGPLAMPPKLSECCSKPMTINSGGVTRFYICTGCRRPCDPSQD